MPPEGGLVATGDSDKTFNRTFQHFEGVRLKSGKTLASNSFLDSFVFAFVLL
jgi:hypothetical protein